MDDEKSEKLFATARRPPKNGTGLPFLVNLVVQGLARGFSVSQRGTSIYYA